MYARNEANAQRCLDMFDRIRLYPIAALLYYISSDWSLVSVAT